MAEIKLKSAKPFSLRVGACTDHKTKLGQGQSYGFHPENLKRTQSHQVFSEASKILSFDYI